MATFDIDKRNELLAKASTPEEERETKVYLILPPEAEDWVNSSGIDQPPQGESPDDFIDFDPEVAITFPAPGSYIGGQVEIRGNARGGNFANYRVEFGSGPTPVQWTQIGPEHGQQHENGLLEVFNTEGLEEGQYTLRLTVRYHDGNQRIWNAPVTIDNTPPTVLISEPKPNRLYVMDEDDQININALVNDVWAMDRVEFAIDGTYFITRTVAPYNERWPLEMRYEAVQGRRPKIGRPFSRRMRIYDRAAFAILRMGSRRFSPVAASTWKAILSECGRTTGRAI